MIPYFASDTNMDALNGVIEKWTDAKYHHMGTKKAGVDCCKMIGLILCDLGVLGHINDEYYGRDWNIHGNLDLVIDSFDEHRNNMVGNIDLAKYQYSQNALMRGDCVCFAMAKSGKSNHAAIYLTGNTMFHCIERRGAHIAQFNYFWNRRAKWIFRLWQLE